MIDAPALRQAAVLLAVTLVAGTLSNATAGKERRLKWIADWKTPPPASTPAPSGAGTGATGAEATPEATAAAGAGGDELQYFEAHFDRVREARDNGAVFLDARASKDFALGHIAGARSFAVWESDIDDKVAALPAEVPTLAPIVVYCNGGQCEDSHLLRDKLMAHGYQDVMVYKDGYPDWQERGQPIDSGAGGK
jgi:rhodanese-related sulfurtransferase